MVPLAQVLALEARPLSGGQRQHHGAVPADLVAEELAGDASPGGLGGLRAAAHREAGSRDKQDA